MKAKYWRRSFGVDAVSECWDSNLRIFSYVKEMPSNLQPAEKDHVTA
jgi:hypothetical protein